MKAKKLLDRVLLLFAAALLVSLVAVLIVRALKDNNDSASVNFIALNETEDKAVLPELELDSEASQPLPDEELLLDIDRLGRDISLLVDLESPPTVDPMPDQQPTEASVSADISSHEIVSESGHQLSDYEIFLNPPSGKHSVDLTLFVSPLGGLNLRSEASTSAGVVKLISYGSSVHVVGVEGDWAEVKLNSGERGFLAKDYLQAGRPPVTESSTVTSVTKTTQTTVSAVNTTTAPVSTTVNSTTISTTEPVNLPDVYRSFVAANGNSSAVTNFNKILGLNLIRRDPARINSHYDSFKDNGDGTITVDGITFAYSRVDNWLATHYDGVACSRAAGDNPVYNRNTGSGIPAQRGLVAVKKGGLKRGTVVFVKGYGMAVVADTGGFSGDYVMDLCYDADECRTANIRPWGRGYHDVYIISSP